MGLGLAAARRACLRACELRGARLLAWLSQQRPEARAAGGLAGKLARKRAPPLRKRAPPLRAPPPRQAAALLAQMRGQCHEVLAEAATVRAFVLLTAWLLTA